jgi:carbon monoxide dehydrogenase subunit G
MAETEYSTEIAAPVERVWSYVEDLNAWAPLMVGFQKLEVVDDRRSIWTLRGDVGILAREVDIQADITLWDPLRRVEFTVTGITERIEGEGVFILESLVDADLSPTEAAKTQGSADPPKRAKKLSLFKRLQYAIGRAVFRRMKRRSAKATPAPADVEDVQSTAPQPDASAASPATSGPAQSRLSFRLQIALAGPMAPMLEVLMGPMLEPAAKDLADGIRQAVEA